ncbi:MAG: hypothetical protein AB7R67_20265 [Vicinamibacterales bacterium]
MATTVNYGGSGDLFVGEDKKLKLHVKDSSGVPVNIAGWTITWGARRSKLGDATVLVALKTATIEGAYNSSAALNTQRAVVTLTDDDLAGIRSGYHSWKRGDPGFETILAEGEFAPQRVTQE